MIIKEIKVKQVLTKSGIGDMEYSLNPYVGCGHRCIYCYADFIGRWRDVLPWGERVEVKVNLLERLKEETRRKRRGRVCIGTVCDPYQPIEEKYELTRQAIEILKASLFPIHILTKSSLCLRDLDIMRGYRDIEVEMTLTTLDDRIRKIFEPFAPSIEERINSLKRLREAGIKTTLFFGPILPYLSDREEVIKGIFRLAEELEVAEVLVDRLNYLNKKLPKICEALRDFPEAIKYYEEIKRDYEGYSAELRQKVIALAIPFSVPVRVIF